MTQKGKVFLVGAGPGDPKLITVYGLECIQKADVIAYDRLVNKELLNHAKKEAELVYCGKSPGNHILIQEEINHLLVTKALQGKIVTRLKGGDPFVFGRGGEEAEVLAKAQISYEIVPGITSGIAAPAYAGIPVTHRDFGTSFTMITGTGRAGNGEDAVNWKAIVQGSDTIAFYMGTRNLAHICQQLIENGKDSSTLVAVIQEGTTNHQKTVTGTLETIARIVAKAEITHPAMIIVGNIVQLREKLNWFEEKGENADECHRVTTF
ncbi:uroporphyrinogen-III C-methyltransferase [Halalkalibacter akibai]|uniref:Uroporphyrinogen-III C-methyltransferase n=1 Tax=Halalkalibacter akibai (strain ATCC 43226 / DSM 21942 / CIP 109018 / JCM 9157 / 1139) TaxID=1236973 RepID=W4QVD0_HALA3|nr:uroporphyrinogen-III C-methyltransferase [Halalkalibacter akibai]GAE36100.1 uroporphyrinogen-III methyltransferase [Halalkalibacter akibai JCM 9157]